MLVEVGLGEVETVTKEDRTRRVPATGFDSIIVSLCSLCVCVCVCEREREREGERELKLKKII